MEGHRTNILIVFWLMFLYFAGILLFTKGFLLTRVVVNQNSSCHTDFAGQAHNYVKDKHGHDGCWMHARFKKAVIIIIDALRYDFVAPGPINNNHELPYQNKLKRMNQILEREPMNSQLYRFVADPPTTTMQRLKGLTTGSLPTFVDASSNFASAAVNEDNFIQQLENCGKNVVFMGDDTWMGLFPDKFLRSYPFPSLNVQDLDTVDDGVIKHLAHELPKKDWDVLIGHLLGVDHCGHTFGPDHPMMERKLLQMDSFIHNITKTIDDDTLLIVFGDHGMTHSGDHGGDSYDELDAALFVYSKSQITSTSPRKGKHSEVAQIDLVPSLSLLLGLPIPFSNLGSVIEDLFNHCPWWQTKSNPERQLYHVLEALHLNAHQVHDYLVAYRDVSNELPQYDYVQLESVFQHTEKDIQALMLDVHQGMKANKVLPRLTKLRNQYYEYLSGVKGMAKAVWAKFDTVCMLLGLLVCVSALIAHMVIFVSSNAIKVYVSLAVASWICLIAVFLSFMQLTPRQLGISLFMATLSIGSITLIIIKVLFTDNTDKSKCTSFGPSFLSLSSSLLMCLYSASLFSNSFIVYEGYVTAYFAQTLIALFGFTLFTSLLQNKPMKRKKFDIIRVITSPHWILCILLGACLLCLRLMQMFRACREEQIGCEQLSYLRAISSIADVTNFDRNSRYFLSVFAVCSLVFLCRRWLRHHGNLTGFSPGVLWFSYGFPLCAAALCSYWALQALPMHLRQSLSSFQLILFPRIVYTLSSIPLIIFIAKPLCIFLLPQREDNSTVFNQDNNLIPRMYNHIKLNWKQHLRSLSKADDSKPPLVYGLATVFSSSSLLLLSCFVPVVFLLLGDGLSLPLSLFIILMFLVLELWSCSTNILKDHYVKWPMIVLWGLLSSEHFYSSGHHPTITAIRWESAYHGFHGDFDYYAIPALLIGSNTLSSFILSTVSLPLLLFWPYFRGRVLFAFESQPSGSSHSRGEFSLNEDQERLVQPLFKLLIGHLLFYAVKMVSSMACAGLHRRHLMVWKIFAPRFLFEGLTFIVVYLLSVLVYFAVLRINFAVDKWTECLKKMQNRENN